MKPAYAEWMVEIRARIDRYMATGQEHHLEMVEDSICTFFSVARPVEALLIWREVANDPEKFGPVGWPIVDEAIRQKGLVCKS